MLSGNAAQCHSRRQGQQTIEYVKEQPIRGKEEEVEMQRLFELDRIFQ